MSQVTDEMVKALRGALKMLEGDGLTYPKKWDAALLAMSSASPRIEGRYTSDAAGQIYRDGSLYLQVSLNTRPDDRKAIAAGVAAILNDPSPQSEDQCARCKGVRAKLAEGRDPEELCDPCYDDSIAALTPPPVTVEDGFAILRPRTKDNIAGEAEALRSAADFLMAHYVKARCDNPAVSNCINCNTVYLASTVLKLLGIAGSHDRMAVVNAAVEQGRLAAR